MKTCKDCKFRSKLFLNKYGFQLHCEHPDKVRRKRKVYDSCKDFKKRIEQPFFNLKNTK